MIGRIGSGVLMKVDFKNGVISVETATALARALASNECRLEALGMERATYPDGADIAWVEHLGPGLAGCRSLKELDLRWNKAITDAGWAALAAGITGNSALCSLKNSPIAAILDFFF